MLDSYIKYEILTAAEDFDGMWKNMNSWKSWQVSQVIQLSWKQSNVWLTLMTYLDMVHSFLKVHARFENAKLVFLLFRESQHPLQKQTIVCFVYKIGEDLMHVACWMLDLQASVALMDKLMNCWWTASTKKNNNKNFPPLVFCLKQRLVQTQYWNLWRFFPPDIGMNE